MREILFRGKMKDNGEWVEGCLHFQWGDTTNDGRATKDAYILGMRGEVAEVDPETVGQYTGKTVKNGKVFDGDIGKSIDGIFLVCWDEEKAAFVMRFYDYPNETLYIEEMWDDAEIIGNIHDNPELRRVNDGN